MSLGVIAWAISYYLAAVAMGDSAPKGWALGIGVFMVVYLAICFHSLTMDRKAATRGALRDLERDAYGLAIGIRELNDLPLVIPGTYMGQGMTETFDVMAEAKARANRAANIVAQYENRFASQVRYLASEFRKQDVPQTDVLFQIADKGPHDDKEVFQVAAGLERLARQLREKPTTN